MRKLVHWILKRAQRYPSLYARLRALKARLRPLFDEQPTFGPPLPPEAYRARITIQEPPPRFQVADLAFVDVSVTNASPCVWPGGGQLALSYHWRRTDGGVWAFDGGRTHLKGSLEPGGTATVKCTVTPPNTPGSFVLEMDLVHGRDAWFGPRGSDMLRREIVVGGMQPDGLHEIDYEQIYAEADLTKNYWGVVGPASAEEFRQLGQGKADMLKSLGLRPDSKILDVGCGTGSLAEPLVDYLGGEGLYYGTDLSEVAVRYCREKFVRPNFVFAKNGMTTLPMKDLSFDFIVFFSVFTHTYPAETRELLTEARRLLSDSGMIIADVFESDIDGDSLGTRAMVVLDRQRMLGLAEALNLEARTLSQFVWDPTGPRRIDRVMRRFGKRSALTASRSGTGALP